LLIVGFWKFVNTNIQDEMFLGITNALTSLIFVHQIIMQKLFVTNYMYWVWSICPLLFGQSKQNNFSNAFEYLRI
jgi:hypothetical protein